MIGTDGTFTAADVRAAFHPYDPYGSPSKVVAVENTQNEAGGKVWAPARLAEVVAAAHELGMRAHLDGARLWNAAVKSGDSEAEIARGFDSIAVCLSKGLGAPVGSLVCGPRDFVKRCHRYRKMYGGGMRQAGILAAAGLHAIEHHRARLVDDHANAKALAEAVAQRAKHVAVDVGHVHTNIVMIELRAGTAAQVIARAKEAGVLLGSATPHRLRAVTHLDVDREGVLRAADVIAGITATL